MRLLIGLPFFSAGLKDNAIPRECVCSILIPEEAEKLVNEITAVRVGNVVTMKFAKACGQINLKVYDGTDVKEVIIPAGTMEYVI